MEQRGEPRVWMVGDAARPEWAPFPFTPGVGRDDAHCRARGDVVLIADTGDLGLPHVWRGIGGCFHEACYPIGDACIPDDWPCGASHFCLYRVAELENALRAG